MNEVAKCDGYAIGVSRRGDSCKKARIFANSKLQHKVLYKNTFLNRQVRVGTQFQQIID